MRSSVQPGAIRQLKIHDERDDDDVYWRRENRNEDVLFGGWNEIWEAIGLDDDDDDFNSATLCGIQDMDFFFITSLSGTSNRISTTNIV